ncbi:MAG: hypothetical protein KJ000_26020 [Pirellulaceae bacterium]|nr:hypothetical protein [Pirellulaceae bacterium]
MIRAVPVQKLPEGLSFPGDLERKIHYDASRRQLAFEGFMSKATFDRLYRLADDREYRRALEELFQLCTFDDSERADRRPAARFVLVAIGLAFVAALFATALLFFR